MVSDYLNSWEMNSFLYVINYCFGRSIMRDKEYYDEFEFINKTREDVDK